MIEYVKGELTEITPASAVVECGGVGYMLNISLNTYTRLQNERQAKVYVYEAIREDAHLLYGFADREERALFLLLITVSGVGPNTARMILSSFSTADLKGVIASGNVNLPKAVTLPPEAEDGLEKCLKEHGEALAPGALTDSMVVPLLRSGVLRGGRLVVKDPSRVLLTPDTLDKLQTRQVRLETAEAARTLCVTINPVSAYGWKFDKDEFMARMREAVDVPVINVKEELA